MRRIVPSLIWFSALAGTAFVARATAAANVPTNSCATLPVTEAEGAGNTVLYVNREYGFSFSLPQGWKGFSVLACRWSGANGRDHDRQETGPLLVIRHPLYTEEDPREDIPIMIFTRKQWGEVNDSDLDSALIVSAAPIPPGEIGRNGKYIFALPPRFINDDLEGCEEIWQIMLGTPLHAARITSRRRNAERSK